MDIDYNTNRISDDVSLSPISSSTLPSSMSSLPTPLPSPTSSISLSAMVVITYSKEFTIECYHILMSKDYTITQKILTIIRLLNNMMNMEQFFYLDLIITLFLSLYSYFISSDVASNTQQYHYQTNVTAETYSPLYKYPYMPHGIRFYFVGNLVVNAYFLWYFSYCRFLNGKDVITLRRSIQLLIHCFQFSSIGLLILCKERNYYISDSEVVGFNNCKNINDINDISCDPVYGEVTFICTANILTTYSFRVIWHTTILAKTLIDEYLSSFVISRGTVIDLLMVLFIPVGSLFSYLSNYHAKDLMLDMMRKLSVTYEMNNISRSTKYYERMADSYHSKAINVLLSLTIPISLVEIWNLNGLRPELDVPTVYVLFIGITSVSIYSTYFLMVEYFLCGKNKYGTMTTVLAGNLVVLVVYDCLLNDNHDLLYPTVYKTLVYLVLLVVVVYQNRSHVSLYSTPVIVAKTLFLIFYTLIYCPLQPFISYIFSFKYGTHCEGNSIDKNTSEIKGNTVTRIDENESDTGTSAYIKIIKVPVLTLLSPIVDYHWENVKSDLKISFPTYTGLATLGKFTVSHHGLHYNVMIWVIVSLIITTMVTVNERKVLYQSEYLVSPSNSQSPLSEFFEVYNRLNSGNWCILGKLYYLFNLTIFEVIIII